MSDDVTLPGTGAVIATDDVSGVQFQKVKLDLGADGVSVPVEGSLPTTEASAADILAAAEAIQVAVEALDNAVAGSELQVDVVTLPALPAGTNNIGDVDVLTLPALPAGDNNIGDVDVASIAAGDNNIGNVDIVTVPADPFGANADAASATGSISAKLRQIAANGIPITGTVTVGSHAVTNAGTFATQVDGSALTALQKIDDPVLVDDNTFTPASSSVMMAGFQADESSTDSVDEGDAGAARMTQDRKVIVTPQPHTAGGLSTFMASGADGSTALVATAQACKGSAGQLYGWAIYNPNTAPIWVIFYNATTGNVSVGTTSPQMILGIPPLSFANVLGEHGITFSTAITVAATTTPGGASAPSTGLDAVFFYA